MYNGTNLNIPKTPRQQTLLEKAPSPSKGTGYGIERWLCRKFSRSPISTSVEYRDIEYLQHQHLLLSRRTKSLSEPGITITNLRSFLIIILATY